MRRSRAVISVATFVAVVSALLYTEREGVSRAAPPRVLVDNPRVRVYRATADDLAGLNHGPAVVVSLENATLGNAVWVDDVAAAGAVKLHGDVVIVSPLQPAAASSPVAGSAPGKAVFTGMSFKTAFENARVSIVKARMDRGAREGFHTHASDTVVVHLTGGQIEDTADGKTVVNRWTRGDAEFEGRGTSHSARNMGAAVDVVLVVLKPR